MKSRNLRILFVVIGAIFVAAASKADDTQKCYLKESRLVVTLVDGDADSPYQGNDAQGKFGILFTASAEGGQYYIPKEMVREKQFLITKGGEPVSPYRFLIAASSAFSSPTLSSCDTPWQFCVRNEQTRIFSVEVLLQYPQESAFFAIRMRRLNVAGKVKYSGGIRQFVTPSVHINNVDVTN